MRDLTLELLRSSNLMFLTIPHPAAFSAETAARSSGVLLENGVKSLILRGKRSNKNFLFVLSAHLLLNLENVREITGEKCEFESAEAVMAKFGVEVGGVPPIGQVLAMDTYYDPAILNYPLAAFSPGVTTETIVMTSADFVKLNSNANMVSFSRQRENSSAG